MLIGRRIVQSRIDRLLAEIRSGRSDALVIAGEPGIGKTTLLHDAVERATEMTVLSVTCVPTESDLEYSGLLTLVRPILRFVDEIPPHQALAIREALGMAPPEGGDAFGVGVAVLSLLAVAGEHRPVLVVVDDAQWLDQASADALRFAARRLFADRVGFLLAARDGDANSFSAAGLEELRVEGLDRNDVTQLLAHSAGTVLPSDVVDRVRDATGGNPLALIELTGRMTPEELTSARFETEPLPIPARLEQAFLSRLSTMPEPTRAALVILAVASVSSFDAVSRALHAAGLPPSALDPAEDHEFISIADDVVTFGHPLVRAAVYHAASPSDRRRAHRALADSFGELDQLELRATHLAGAALGADEDVAAALTAAALQARGRMGYAAASAAFEKAARLSPELAARLERLRLAAETAWAAGDATRALRLVDAAEPLPAPPSEQSRLLNLRGRIERRVGVPSKARELLLRAAALVDNPAVEAEILSQATIASYVEGDLSTAVGLAGRVRALVVNDGSTLDAHADFLLGWLLCLSGRLTEARPSLERSSEALLARDRPASYELYVAANVLQLLERTAESVEIAGRAVRAARDEGPWRLLSELEALTKFELQAGRWTTAIAHGEEALTLTRLLGHAQHLAALLVDLATIDAAHGDADRCRRRLEEAQQICEQHGLFLLRAAARGVLGKLELALGRPDLAVAPLRQALTDVERMGLHDRDASPQPDLVEALIQLGRREEAEAVLAGYAERAPRGTPLWGGALVARCRGQLADQASYADHFESALQLHHKVEDRFEQARTQLRYGELLRRAGRKVESRDRLREALSTFNELQAAPWSDRAERELRATGERIRRAAPSVSRALTPQELQVALPVAEGRTNKEAAAELFLSPKTIEFHLASIYRKLGVTSRRELMKRVSEEGLEVLAAG